jgi:tRNA (cmo5U34)-methyltransferase
MTDNPPPNQWLSTEHALEYLARADTIPHRVEGEAALLDEIEENCERVLDLGTGDGRLMALVLLKCPRATGLAVDSSPTMLAHCRDRFQDNSRVTVAEHDFTERLADWGLFNCVVSSFAIHHVSHQRKRELYGEIWPLVRPGGVFCNLEHVSSPTQALHHRFLAALDTRPEDEDPCNQLLDVETQLKWLREWGFEDVDCLWKWREMALLRGSKPCG